MAKICVQCEKKIGLFKTPIEGIYCSYECRDAGKKAIVDSTRRAGEAKVEAERAAAEARAQEAEAAKRAAEAEAVKHACPKCGRPWSYREGGGAGGLNAGKCDKCSFSADFVAVEKCPTCTCMSLVVDDHGARCPRCKFRRA